MDSIALPARTRALLRSLVALGLDPESPPQNNTDQHRKIPRPSSLPIDAAAWGVVPAMAAAHHVTAFAHRGIERLPAGVADHGAGAALEAALIPAVATNLAVLSHIGTVTAILREAGIPTAVSPSAAGVLLLSDFARCELTHAALLVSMPHLRRAEDALVAAGYVPPSTPARTRRAPGAHQAPNKRQRVLTSPGMTEVRVVLETTLSAPSRRPLLEAALERVGVVRVHGRHLPALAVEDRFIALCVRAAVMRWQRLDYQAAIAALLAELPSAHLVLDRVAGATRRDVLGSALVARDLLSHENSLSIQGSKDLRAVALAQSIRSRDSGPASPDPEPRGLRGTGGGPVKLILRQFQSPGDLVMLTAAVRDLHVHHPGRFITDVRTSCPDLWLYNPHITPIADDDVDANTIDCQYPLIHRSNQTPFHFIHGFMQFLNDRLGLQISPTAFKGDVHLSPEERTPSPLLEAARGVPYWLVSAGGKFDYTIKWWSRSRYQAVVDHFRGRLLFVQVGEAGHHHPPLDGALDLRGQTSMRSLLQLVYGADGVLGPVSLLMHLAAAVETRPGIPPSRPCVVVAGGREPVHWEAYPGHQFLHTIGALPCCASGGCWRSRTLPVGDGDSKDHAAERCVDVVDGLPHCMEMIGADDVIRAIELYLSAGQSRPMSAEEHRRLPTPSPGAPRSDRPLPIWYEPAPPPRAIEPEVTFAVLTHGDHLPLIRRCLESIERHCPRDEYRLLVGANEVSDEVREFLHRKRHDGVIDRLHESPINITKNPMMRRLFSDVRTELVWWLDDDTHFIEPTAFGQVLRSVRASPASTVLWGHVYFLWGNEWGEGLVDPVAFSRTASWYRHVPLPGDPQPDGREVDHRWFFPTGGCWVARMSAMRDLDWPDRRLVVQSCFEDVLLAEAVRQQGWQVQDLSPIGINVNDAPRRFMRGPVTPIAHSVGR